MTYAYKISKQFGTVHNQEKLSVGRRFLLENLEKIDLKHFTKIATNLLRITAAKRSYLALISLRFFITRLFPFDPLREMKSEKFSVSILTSPKDIQILPYSLISILEIYSEELEEIFIVCPKSLELEVAECLEKLTLDRQIALVTDEKIIDTYISENYQFSGSHPKMESIKLCLTELSNSKNMLVADGDTLYLKKRIWKSENHICLVVAQEYMPEHVNFHREKLNLSCSSGLGFVTHHGLFIKSEINQIHKYWGGMKALASSIDSQYQKGFISGAFPSEWQMYGDWIYEQENFQVALARFDNLGVSRTSLPLANRPDSKQVIQLLDNLKHAVPSLGSLSLHDYK